MDFSKAFLLLSVADKARQWPQLKKLEQAALDALMELQDPPQPKQQAAAIPRVAPSTSAKPEPSNG